jgi:hypothetical protein
MQATDTPRPFSTTQRPAQHQSLLRTHIQAAHHNDVTLPQAQALLIQALDELQLVPIDGADPQQADRFHEAFVQILHVAHALHPTVEGAVLEHMAHALRVHFADHDRVAHALVSSWTSTTPHQPIALVLDLIDILASDAAPLPFWTSHLLQRLPPTEASREAAEGQRRARELLQPRLDELAPAHLAKALQRLEADPSPHGLQQIVGDLGALALAQFPTAGLSRFVETPPEDDEALVWFSHQHPSLVCVGDTPCDDHWLLTPLGHGTLDRLLHLCTRLEAGVAHRLRRQMLYQVAHAARLALVRPARRHPCFALAALHRIAQAIVAAGDHDPWADVLEWLAPHHTGHHAHPSSASAQHSVFDILLLPSFEQQPLLALRSVLEAQVDPAVWLPGLVRCSMGAQPGLSRLLRQLLRVHGTMHLHHALVQEVLHQCPPRHLLQVGLEMGLTAFSAPPTVKGLTRDALHALARAQARFGPGWVPFSLLAHLLVQGRRFGHVGLGAAEGEWLLAFAQENGHKLPPGMPGLALVEALEDLFDVLTRLGLKPEPVAQACIHLFEQCAQAAAPAQPA